MNNLSKHSDQKSESLKKKRDRMRGPRQSDSHLFSFLFTRDGGSVQEGPDGLAAEVRQADVLRPAHARLTIRRQN